MFQLLLYQLKMAKDFQNNCEQDLKELLNGINIGQKLLIRLEIAT